MKIEHWTFHSNTSPFWALLAMTYHRHRTSNREIKVNTRTVNILNNKWKKLVLLEQV
jgi:hypothetical protein